MSNPNTENVAISNSSSSSSSALVEAENNHIHKEKFYEGIERLLLERIENELINPDKKKRKTFTYIKLQEYNALISTIEEAKSKTVTKSTNEYNILRDYDVMLIGDTKKVIKKRENNEDIRFLVPFEHLFDTIYRIHLQVGHKCRDVMMPACKKNHLNLSVDMINIFNNTCQQCLMNKKRNKTTGLVVKPILSKNFNSRAQMDLVDMQTLPDGEFKWIMVYQDHFTKFIILRPLRAKTAVEVTNALFEVFSFLGIPAILQSDNGREFRNQIVVALKSMWPDLSLIHGRARHPQSQGSVERANADIKKMLATWMRDNKSTKWSVGLKFVQLKKNHSHHTGIKCTPYKAVFGIDTPLGLSSIAIPVEEWSKLETAKQLFDAVGYEYSDDELGNEEDNDEGEVDVFDPKEFDLNELTITPPEVPSVYIPIDSIDKAANELLGIRESVRENQEKQAESMRTRSKKYLPEANIGDYVLLPIPDVDKGLTEAPNLICRIIDIEYERSLYELACEVGVFTEMFARNCFDLVKDSNILLNIRTDKTVKGVRAAVTELSIGGGQGMIKCNCTSQCSTNRCSCKKSKLLCNSKCHGSNPGCKNK
ncbi:unnamed protein product [Brachionus calyciflorus]|uniref:Integrase catalytic domain-containing protein n=1 Tax=Brachionus calyciflorus TaxID=104777 RepID=A0A814HQB7_9BILA|nr:unnamed protein product [Brachionus calyciflorus]